MARDKHCERRLYDDLARLSSNSCASGWGQTFSYDAFGNITKSVISGHTGLAFQPTYATNNRISSVPGATITYDGMGNMTADNIGNTYSYDAEGRPSKVNNPTQTLTYFDALGRATDQTRSGVYTQIVYAPSGQKFAIMNGTTLNRYIDPMVAGMAAVHTGPNGNPPNSGYFQHADWLGSSRLAVTGSGTATYDRSYAPFGEPYDETATMNRNFTGQTEDTTSGLYDFLFRQQSQSQGRWLVPDPAGLAAVDITNPQTWNRYAYVANNPLSNVDPLGLYVACDYNGDSSCDDGGGAGGGSGGGGGQINGGPCGAYCAPLPGLISPGQVPQWYLDQVNNGQANLAHPGAPPVDAAATNIWVYCSGSVLDASCQAPSQALPGSLPVPVVGTKHSLSTGAMAQGVLQGNKNTWQNANQITDLRTVAAWYGASAVAGATGYAVYDISQVQNGLLFGTRLGGNNPLFNSGDALRIGWGYSRQYGQYIFRIGGTLLGNFLQNPHVNLWPPSWWGGPPGP